MKTKFILILIGLFLLLGYFYWFQIRPSQIRHNCSWVKRHTDAIPARIGITEEQLIKEGKIKVCLTDNEYHSKYKLSQGAMGPLTDNPVVCEMDNRRTIDANRPQEFVPEKDWYEKASQQEYSFCLHNGGL